MKKFAITLCILGGLGLASGAFASIQEENMGSVPFLRSDGHSEQMSRIADYVIYKHSNETAIPYYNQDPYADADSKWYTAIKRWFDPAQDDMLFGRHEITFSNKFFDNGPGPVGASRSTYAKEKNVEPVATDDVVEDIQAETETETPTVDSSDTFDSL